jgi:hypothetical protein
MPAVRGRSTRLMAPLALALLTTVLLLAGSGTAEAASGYRYWNYFHVTNGKYVFAQTGPDGYTPKDGSVEAYRYGLSSTAAGIKPRTPASTYTAADICGDTRAGAGQKRVGVLIDYGTEADAGSGDTVPQPRAACAVVPKAANGQQVLGKVAQVRIVKQLTCGIDGYPVKTCSVTVKNAPATSAETTVSFALPRSPTSDAPQREADARDSGGVSWPIVGVVAAIVVLGAGALLMSRRNRA